MYICIKKKKKQTQEFAPLLSELNFEMGGRKAARGTARMMLELLCHTGRWRTTQVSDKRMVWPPLTCLQAPTPPSWLTTSCQGLLKYLRSIRLHEPTQSWAALHCTGLGWAGSPGRGLQVMSCRSPPSHRSSSFSLSVSSSISSSWTLALMAVSSWGHKCEVRLAQWQGRAVSTPPDLYSLCQMVKN